MCRRSRPPSQGWRTFLSNHVDGIAAIDLFVLPTIAFQILYCLVIVRHGRRRWVSFGVTANPTAEWISRQVTEAFPWDHAPRYLIRDRDTSYGPAFLQRIRAMGIRDHPIAPRSPWQNAYVERLIGSIRRECLDHMIVFGEAHLRRILRVDMPKLLTGLLFDDAGHRMIPTHATKAGIRYRYYVSTPFLCGATIKMRINVIAVGGFSLSRGLTLEGLMVSYFLRNSMMYDTLMQMGRWFGYRPGYEDLCRVWMPEEAEGWYAHIADSIEELREELRVMEAANA